MIHAADNMGRTTTVYALKSGRVIGVNKHRFSELPFFLCTNPPNNDVAVTANNISAATAMGVSGEGPMQLSMLGAVRNEAEGTHNACSVLLTMHDGSGTTDLMNSPCHIDTIFGPGGQMYPLPEAIYIDEDRSLTMVAQDLSGGDESVRICAVGQKYTQLQQDPNASRTKERLKKEQFDSFPYFYTFDNGVAAITSAFGEQQFQIIIDGSHNFEIHQFSAVSDGTFSIDIVDLTKGESIINAPNGTHYPVPSELFLGDFGYPYRLHEPVIIFGGQRLLVTLQNTTPDVNNIYLTLGGKALKVREWVG